MAKVWDDFIPLLLPHVGGAPSATMRLYLAQAAADFFARTYLWRREIDPLALSRGVAEYDLDVYACGGVIEDIRSVIVDGVAAPLLRVQIDAVPVDHMTTLGAPTSYWLIDDRAIGVFPTPDKRYTLRANAVLKTSRTATGVDDWIFETWADAIVAGAAARVTDVPGKEWSNPALAAEYKLRFEKAIVAARVRALRSTPVAVAPRPFA
ncbi:MAG: hypothetical protein KAX65_05510 [Caldilineaceae bacterium]|jgi:hypothetical protein|nr:hypothetical protein [Caldilineaceae bacterium]